MNWKAVAIIFIILLFVETSYLAWSLWYVAREDKRGYECLYDICADNYDALYDTQICTCYDLDLMGEYIISKTKYMGG